jgi:TBC1 domain family member 14
MRTAAKEAGSSCPSTPSRLARRSPSSFAEKRRLASLESARALRTARHAAAFPTWESSILPNWRVVLHPDAEGLALKKLWWEGTMPVRWRGRLWGLCIGNGLAVSKGSYAGHLGRARKGVEQEQRSWAEVMERLEKDVEDTLPTLKLFQKGGVMHEELVDVLLAYTAYAASLDLRAPRYVGWARLLLSLAR